MSIVLENVTKIYGTQKAVDNISFTINKGEVVGFLGPNGAGKSTTMKIITGYLKADAGRASVCGEDIGLNEKNTKQKTGYLPEANPLYYDMYVREYLQFVADVFGCANAKEKIEKIIEQTGLKTEAHKKTGQLSKGYKQRTGLAAALLHDPEVLILDEPTSGLDPNQIIEIRNLIKEQGKNKTVLFSSHILQEVEALCDRVIIINKGKIVADDLLSNLKKNLHPDSIKVVFKEEIEYEKISGLKNINSVSKENNNTWRIRSTNTDDARKELMQFAIDNNLNIISLQAESNNLEEIFRTLTQNVKS